MNEVQAFWYGNPSAAMLADLRGRLGDGVSIESGETPAHGSDVGVLIAVSPPVEVVEACPNLQTVIVPQAGFTSGLKAALEGRSHISVHNCHHNAAACAETAVALMLGCAKFINKADSDLRTGGWGLRYSGQPQIVLRGKGALILGYGAIGRAIGPICVAMGMSVTAVRRSAGRSSYGEVDVRPVDELSALLPQADVLICALPSTDATDGLIGSDELAALPTGAMVVNVGRASQIDEAALYDNLVSGHLSGAGIDVWSNEPQWEAPAGPMLPSKLAFHELDNVVMSPHKAGWLPGDDSSLVESLAAMLLSASLGEGLPNRVDRDLGY